MQINITRFFNEACPRDYSASAAEIGENAGADTWRAACDDSAVNCRSTAIFIFILDIESWLQKTLKQKPVVTLTTEKKQSITFAGTYGNDIDRTMAHLSIPVRFGVRVISLAGR